MIRETYRGQKIRTARGAYRGTVKLTINDTVLDDRDGPEEQVVRRVKHVIDLAAQDPKWRGIWYVLQPGDVPA